MSHNNQKKTAVINDLSGFGRCSLTVSIPILSAMRIQCCPLPTSIFSNHTGFLSHFMTDFTDKMEPYFAEWKKLGLQFDGIASGFLGSADQIEIVQKFLKEFRTEKTVILIDPVMGDYGKAYLTYTEEMCQRMKTLVSYADILTPNVTEACILTDTPYQENWKQGELVKMAEQLLEQGPDKVVITGIVCGTYLGNLCCEKGKAPQMLRTKKIGKERSGTGDVFASILLGDAVNGVPLVDSVKKASKFIKACIKRSVELDIPTTDGVCFEELLDQLIPASSRK